MMLCSSTAALGLVGILSIPGIYSIFSQIHSRAPKDNFYADEDGVGTPTSIAAFSNRRPKTAIIVLSTLGLATSIVISISSGFEVHQDDLWPDDWVVTALWTIILVQAAIIGALHSPTQTQLLGFMAMLSSLATLALTISYNLQYGLPRPPINQNSDLSLLRSINMLILTCLMFSCVLLPRRPDVFHKDRKVDAQWTVSILARYSWSWVIPILKLAIKNRDLDERDIPEPDHSLRAAFLLSSWHKFHFSNNLVFSLLRAYKNQISLLWSILFIRSVIGLGPFWVILQLIEMLEARLPGESTSPKAWPLIASLAIFTFADQWLESWLMWYADTKMLLPIRGQLSALIFEKSLKRKNVKSADPPKDHKQPHGTDDSIYSGFDDNKHQDDDDDKYNDNGNAQESSVLKSRQAIVNLVGVDAKRIAEFSMRQNMVFACIVKLILYSVFLVKLLGLLPVLAGGLVWALVIPVNLFATQLDMKYEGKLMRIRDEKLAVVNETLLGIRQIKFSALECQWENRVFTKREKELGMLTKLFLVDLISMASWVFSPILLAVASLSTYAIIHGDISPSIAFVSIGIFKSLEVSLSTLPEVFGMAIDFLISARRISTYLQGPEIESILSEGPNVCFNDATIAWPVDKETLEGRFILEQINLTFPAGELSIISGKTGTGKSLLLSAILGEADLIKGSIHVPATVPPLERHDDKAHPGNWVLPGSVAYVAQTPWLENASLRDNILFGLPFIWSRYNHIMNVCALKQDLQVLPDGDKTELGANGVNLSGGQKWRVTLARAIYSRAEILILDDIFSAVDANVGYHIFNECLAGGICRGRTRILVTHHVTLVQKQAKFIVELGDGTVIHSGLPADLEEASILCGLRPHQDEGVSMREETTANLRETLNSSTFNRNDEDVPLENTFPKHAKKLVEEEIRERGNVKGHVYATYMKDSGGLIYWVICALLYVIFEASNIGRGWWVRVWTGDSETSTQSSRFSQEHSFSYSIALHSSQRYRPYDGGASATAEHNVSYYLWIYIAIATFSGIMGTLRFALAFMMSIKASRAIFQKMLFTVIRTPLRWLDTVPIGRILNRLTSDFEIIDSRITFDIGMLFWRGLGIFGIFVAAILVSIYIFPLAFLLCLAAYIIGGIYMRAAPPIKRLESIAKSPVFELFSASLTGLSTLRVYKRSEIYSNRMHSLLDTWNVRTYWSLVLNRWMGFLMGLLGTIFTTITGVIVISAPGVTAAMAGFTLSFALEFSLNMLLAIRAYSSLELDMNATERVIEYMGLETESLEGEVPAGAWPTSGKIEVKNLTIGYSPDLPAVLKNVSFTVANNERVGIIGRTGAGKSSLTLALFRFLEARSGKIIIDDLDISKLNLHSLRSRLAIIQQDPVLFSGSIRSNLDPFNDHTDDDLRRCLSRLHLTDSKPAILTTNEPSSSAALTTVPSNTNIFEDLYSTISESGGNLSQGQRQLLCIARAIIARPKIIVLDEATSAVDMETDALIQSSIREAFTDSTLIVIAHRLSTIADFDRVLVLSEGSVAEFGTPKELWNKEGGIFRDMCEHSGEQNQLRKTILGE